MDIKVGDECLLRREGLENGRAQRVLVLERLGTNKYKCIDQNDRLHIYKNDRLTPIPKSKTFIDTSFTAPPSLNIQNGDYITYIESDGRRSVARVMNVQKDGIKIHLHENANSAHKPLYVNTQGEMRAGKKKKSGESELCIIIPRRWITDIVNITPQGKILLNH